MATEDILAVASISSHRVAVTVGDARDESVVAHKQVECRWFDLGHRARLEALADCIRLAEDSAGIELRSIFLSRSCASIGSRMSTGYASLGQEMVLGPAEKAWAMRRAREQATGIATEVVMALPVGWRVRGHDGERDVEDPEGMRGSHLSCQVLLVTAQPGYADELRALGRELGKEVEDIIPQPVALWRGIGSRLQRRGNSLVIDLGARHTTVLVQRRDRFAHLETRGTGGDDLTRALAEAMAIPLDDAEQLKRQADIGIDTNDLPGQQTLFAELAQDRVRRASHILSAEVDRTFEQLADELRAGGWLAQQGCLHLVGRAAALGGLPRRLGDIFDLPVRLGSGADDRDPAAELDGLIVAGLVRAAADCRRHAIAAEGPSLSRTASGLWAWLMHRYR
jgi:cell division protein FtsA